MMKRMVQVMLVGVLLLGLCTGANAEKTVLRFYFPVGVAGPLARYMGELTDAFNASHPDIVVEPIYSGGYVETIQRSITAAKSGNPPDLALLTAADVWTASDEGILLPLTSFIEEEGGQAFLDSYYEAFLRDCYANGQYYAIPFQKSTPIFYYNKDAFRQAGLDPNSPPQTWAELKEMAAKLVIRENGQVTRWGLEIPIDQWLFSAFAMQNGGLINNSEGTKTYLDSAEVVGALSFMCDLATSELMPPRRFFGDSSADFVAGKTAMMYNSTGSLRFVKESATFDWGVAYLPGNKKRIVPTGGGQLVIFSGIPKERQRAAWEFIKWATSPEQAAEWSIKSGYVAVNKGAFEVDKMKKYVAEMPEALVARDQLEYAYEEPPSTHNARQIAQIMTDAVEKALAGQATPKDALAEAQSQADRVLRLYQ